MACKGLAKVLPPGGSCLVSNGHHRVALRLHVFMQSLPMREAPGVTTSTNKRRSRCLLTWLRAVSEFSLITPQYGQKAICLHFPSMLINCLTRHPCQWKFISRNSQSVPTWKSGGTMTIKLGSLAFTKVDRAAGRCFSKLSLVYKGTQSGSVLNWSGGHSARRPSSRRMGNQ